MKTTISAYLLLLLLMLASCASDSIMLEEPGADDTAESSDDTPGEMTFITRAVTLSRASSNGIYDLDYYPVDDLFLTSYHRDRVGVTQYYFTDIKMTAENRVSDQPEKGLWRAKGWYWPIQGLMEFMSYWSPKVYGSPNFRELTHADGTVTSHMEVDARGGIGTDKLDGKTDFLYIAQNNVFCPQSEPMVLTYKHGLAWITMSLQVCVTDPATGEIDAVESQKVIDRIKVQKIVLEDVSRTGIAYIVPGKPIAWLIDKNDIKDQLYTRPSTATTPRGQYSYFDWIEVDDGQTYAVPDYVTLSTTEQYLGLYTPDAPGQYTGNGLLIIPQHKTAITVYYKIVNGKLNDDGTYSDLEMTERYECRDNADEWEAGKRYHYNIRFTSTVDELHTGVHIIETAYEINYSDLDDCFDSESFGQVMVKGSDGSSFNIPVFVLDTYHNQGSPFQDEMDYLDGGEVF